MSSDKLLATLVLGFLSLFRAYNYQYHLHGLSFTTPVDDYIYYYLYYITIHNIVSDDWKTIEEL